MRCQIAALVLLVSVSYAAAAGFGFMPGGFSVSASIPVLVDGGSVPLTTSGGILLTAN